MGGRRVCVCVVGALVLDCTSTAMEWSSWPAETNQAVIISWDQSLHPPPTRRLFRIHINLISYRWHPHSILVSSGQIWRLISYFRPNTIKWYWTDVSFHTSVPIQWLMEPSACRRLGETYELGWKGLIVAQGGAKQWISAVHCKKPKHYYGTCIYCIHLLLTILYFHVCSCNFSRTDVGDSYSEVI